jgi:hypothetical protein
MSLYTMVFIVVTILLLIGLGLFSLVVMKIDKWVDKKERLGRDSMYKSKADKKDDNPEIENHKK